MRGAECREFLVWALPRMGFRPAGFRRVRGQVCKRIARRLHALELPDLDAYRRLLETDPTEWRRLDSLCRITISRFCRDRPVFDWLERTGLPGLADEAQAGDRNLLRCWSVGCGSGEEPYSLRIMWDLALARRFPALEFEIVATDADPALLARARTGIYQRGSLRELPDRWITGAFDVADGNYRLRRRFRQGVRFARQDIRRRMPAGPFDLILCRNLAFTYFDDPAQRRILARLAHRLRTGGLLAVGRKESIPEAGHAFRAEAEAPGLYRLWGEA